jgi:hypothetical protein
MAKMNHSTVTDVSPAMSTAATNTGGEAAKSNATRLQEAFPGSPIWGGVAPLYDAAAVTAIRGKLKTNKVGASDRADAAGYYGFPTIESGENDPSAADLNYDGAPDISGVKTDSSGVNKIASPYMPNLLPPDSFNPTMDNQTAVVLDLENAHAGTTPGMGDGLANPYAESPKIHALDALDD